jgi:hypothetical protein
MASGTTPSSQSQNGSVYFAEPPKVVVDENNTVDEGDKAAEENNTYLHAISVSPGIPQGPDLYVQAFSMNPVVPVEGQPVSVSLTIGNQGTTPVPAAGVLVRWFAGEHFPTPACEWTVAASAPIAVGAAVMVQCTYAGYPSWYPSLITKVVLDANDAIAEGDKKNNTYLQQISVSR